MKELLDRLPPSTVFTKTRVGFTATYSGTCTEHIRVTCTAPTLDKAIAALLTLLEKDYAYGAD